MGGKIRTKGMRPKIRKLGLKDFGRIECTFIVGYAIVIVIGIIIRDSYSFSERTARSLNATLPLASIFLGLFSIIRNPLRFWKFALIIFSAVLAAYLIAHGFWLGFSDVRVYKAALGDFKLLPEATLTIWLTVEALKLLARWQNSR